MDELPVDSIKRYESELLDFVHANQADIINDLRVHKALTDEVVAKLKSALSSFTERFATTV